jgi:hypothetical protein
MDAQNVTYGASSNVDEALDKRTIFVGSVAELEALPSPFAGQGASVRGVPFIYSGSAWEPSAGFVTPDCFESASDGVSDDWQAITDAYAFYPVVKIINQHAISKAVFPPTGSRTYFNGGKLLTSQIITGDECAIKVVDAANVEIHDPHIDCQNFSGNSGIIVRENAADVQIFNVQVDNAVWDATRGGGRAVIVESNTGTEGRILVDGILANDVDTVYAQYGDGTQRKNAVIVNNVIGVNVEKMVALFSSLGNPPTSGDRQQSIITNVVGYNVAQPLRFTTGFAATIDNFYVYNSPTYGAIGTVVQGVGKNITVDNFTYEGDCII